MTTVASHLGLLAGGLVLLSVGADRFVLGAARLSVLARLSPVVIGAVVIGFGTSLPELVVSVLAAVEGTQDLALGNVTGSNTANVLLVLGAAAVVREMVARPVTLRREAPIMLGAVGLFALVTVNGELSLADALALLVAGGLALGVIVRSALRDRVAADEMSRELDEFAGSRVRPLPAVAFTVLGLGAVLAGAQLVVTGAVGLAEAVGVSDVVIGVTVVALGTSLPELVTAAAAARRGETELVIGNVLGSNLFNSLVVAGSAGLVGTVPLAPSFGPNVLVMLAACGIATGLLRTGHVIRRGEGALLLGLYAAAIAGAVTFG